jgi:hypothetical protein
MSACRPRLGASRALAAGTRSVAVTLKPSVMVLVVCALGGAGHLHALPHLSALDAVQARVAQVRAEVAGRWRCDTATRRALLTDGDAEGLYAGVQAACPAVVEPVVAE